MEGLLVWRMAGVQRRYSASGPESGVHLPLTYCAYRGWRTTSPDTSHCLTASHVTPFENISYVTQHAKLWYTGCDIPAPVSDPESSHDAAAIPCDLCRRAPLSRKCREKAFVGGTLEEQSRLLIIAQAILNQERPTILRDHLNFLWVAGGAILGGYVAVALRQVTGLFHIVRCFAVAVATALAVTPYLLV
ncbi:MAG TPA: hypothetical protein PLX97_03820, partial [Gemmatales bacterium]|nr:hypothetical protein [Gemmatales bacterium]